MCDKLEDNQERYFSFPHKYWCKFLHTIKVKYNRKMAANKIKKLASAKAAYNLYRDRSVSITTKNNSSTGFLRNNKRTNNKDPKHNSNHRYCVF